MSGPRVQTSSEGDRDSRLTRGSGWGRNWNARGGGGEEPPCPDRHYCWLCCGPGPVPGLLSALSHAHPFLGQRCPLCADEGAGIANGRVRAGFPGVQHVTGSLCVCFNSQVPPVRTPSSPRCSGRPESSVPPVTMNSGARLCGTWTTPSTS